MNRSSFALLSILSLAVLSAPAAPAQEGGKKPNILVIMGDDIGLWNLNLWNRGMCGFRTPNIDRIGKEGAILSQYYGQQSCTAGRAAFILGGRAPTAPASRRSASRALPSGSRRKTRRSPRC